MSGFCSIGGFAEISRACFSGLLNKNPCARTSPWMCTLSSELALIFTEPLAFARSSRIGPETVYVFGGDLPLGIYRQIHLPPQVVYRVHLGNVLRLEIEDLSARV